MSSYQCPCCGKSAYRGSYKGVSVYKCSNPVSSCNWNKRHSKIQPEGRTRIPLARTVSQLERVREEFNGDPEESRAFGEYELEYISEDI